ncbi:MAG: glycerate kinase [Gammaproteobacteria bacterium]
MKVILAPNAMKGTLSATEVISAMQEGIRKISPAIETVVVPVADGGDGTVEVLKSIIGGDYQENSVTGPLGKTVNACWLYDAEHRLAVIEVAKAVGLSLLQSDELRPLDASTTGVGELILAALERGAERIIIGLGGSATTDAGMGLLSALGVRFLDAEGQLLQASGAAMCKIRAIDTHQMDSRVRQVSIQVMCDVRNPFSGLQGAAYSYAPQKGATQEDVAILDEGLVNVARLVEKDSGVDITGLPGGGAAGGLGAVLMVFLDAKLVFGADLVLELAEFDRILSTADLVLTAEGRFDQQSFSGKAPIVVAAHARAAKVPCIIIAGQIESGLKIPKSSGITAAYQLFTTVGEYQTSVEIRLADQTSQVVGGFLKCM